MFGGNDPRQESQNAINQQFEFDNEMWSFMRAQEWSLYHNAVEAQFVAQLNEKAINNFKQEMAFRSWQDRENMRLYSYANEVKAYNSSVESYYEQLDFNEIAEELTLQDTNRAYQDKLTSIGFENEGLINKFLEGGRSLKLEADALKNKVNQAKNIAGLQVKEAQISRDFDLLNDELNRVGLRDGMAATKADAAFKLQGMRAELIQKEGQQRASGQVGRSAEKAIQAMLATHGNAQAALSDSLTRSGSKYALDLKKLDNELKNKTDLTNLQYANIANQLTNEAQNASNAQAGIDLRFEGIKTETAQGKKQLQDSLISAGEQHEADINRINMDRYQADINASSILKSIPKLPPQQSLPLMIPDTVYQPPMQPQDKPLPRRGINTVHDTKLGDMLISTAVKVGVGSVTGGIGSMVGGGSFGTGVSNYFSKLGGLK